MAKIHKSTVTKSWEATSRCYCRALRDEYLQVFTGFTDNMVDEPGMDKVMREILMNRGLPARSPSINERYVKYLKSDLSTSQLESIIDIHERGLLKRDPATIDIIALEIFERAIKKSSRKVKDE